jgi:hypothetical protein
MLETNNIFIQTKLEFTNICTMNSAVSVLTTMTESAKRDYYCVTNSQITLLVLIQDLNYLISNYMAKTG